MFVQILKSKIHRAVVTEANLNYIGSITIDAELMDKAGILPNEKVYIVNNNNGERFETYVIPGERNSGVICLNGAAARKAEVGDVVIIMAVVLINAVLGVFQESKAEKAIEALQEMSKAQSKVIRDGKQISIASEDLVVGDIIVLEAGDSVPADARIIECSNLKVEEAALTGESVPVDKNNEYIEDENIPLGDKKNCLFSSTYVTNGKAKAVVTSVGMNTEIGKIASMLSEQKEELTPLQHKLNKVGNVIGIMALAICAFVFILEMIAINWDWSNFSKAFITAVALAVAAIPEGLATVVTIVLSIGVTKMSKKNAIVKKLPAVETLGSCNVICSDKTGTLTQNKMTVTKLYLSEIKDVKNLTEEEMKMIHSMDEDYKYHLESASCPGF